MLLHRLGTGGSFRDISISGLRLKKTKGVGMNIRYLFFRPTQKIRLIHMKKMKGKGAIYRFS
jgi:hypothetical protein